MKTKIKKFILLVLVVFAISCSKDGGEDEITVEKPVPAVKDVYVVGHQTIDNIQHATLWKNGVPTLLNNTVNESDAKSVFVTGNDVYVCGYEVINSIRVAKYWKNGSETTLSDPALYADTYEIAVSGNDVYVVGSRTLVLHGADVATVWKNGVATSLPSTNNTYDARATGVVLLGTDVHICGDEATDTNTEIRMVKYWKNGVGTNITTGSYLTAASDIAIAASDVYILGKVGYGQSRYWKNGEVVLFSNKTDLTTTSIATNGSDIYISGYLSGKAMFWKNETPTTLSSYDSQAFAITVAPNGDTYAVGTENTTKYMAKIWVNGVQARLSNGNSTESLAWDVFLTYK